VNFLVSLVYAFVPHSVQALYGDLIAGVKPPSHACKLLTNYGEGVCSGSVVNKRVFKTAAHCLKNPNTKSYELICPDGSHYQVASLSVHPKHQKAHDKRQFDVGLVFLSQDYVGATSPTVLNSFVLKEVLQTSFCAVWSYGPNIKNLHAAGELHGVRLESVNFADSLIVAHDPLKFMVQAGDSGGGLYCYTDHEWVNLASVYGHDFTESYLLRNDMVVDFLRPYIRKEFKNSKSIFATPYKPGSEESLAVSSLPKRIKIGFRYKVKTFSTVEKDGGVFGIGDQLDVDFLVRGLHQDGEHVQGDLVVRDASPTRYLCVDQVLCRGEYENVVIHVSRLSWLTEMMMSSLKQH